MRYPQAPAWRRGGFVLLGVLFLSLGWTIAGGPLQELLAVQEMVRDRRYDRALELARRLAEHEPLFRALPAQVQAERTFHQGDPVHALGMYRRLTPAGSCLVFYVPQYRNSCQRMARILDHLGDAEGSLEMLRRLAFGAGIRDGGSPAHLYRQIAGVYGQLGNQTLANAFDRAVVHCFDSRKEARGAREALDRRQGAVGEHDQVILESALSNDPLLRRVGLSALPRLDDPAAALDRLLDEAASGEATAPLDLIPSLYLEGVEEHLHDLLRNGSSSMRQVAGQALHRIAGLSYPYLGADGTIQSSFDDSSAFSSSWGTPFLLDRLSDPYEDDRVQIMALDALGHLADPRGLDAILRLVDHPAPAWRVHAVHALRGYRSEQVERILVSLRSDPDPLVRLFALAGIARRGLPDAADLLAHAAAVEPHPLVAAALVEGLSAQASPGLADQLADLAARLSGPAAAKAGEALWRLEDPRARTALEAALEGPAPASRWAARALSLDPGREETSIPTPLLDRMAPPSPVADPVEETEPGSSPDELLRASLLGVIPDGDAVAMLLESDRWSDFGPTALALANAGVRTNLEAIRRRARTSRYDSTGRERVTYRVELIEALGWLQDDGSLPLFREVLRSGGGIGGSRAAAARALGRLGDAESSPLLLAVFRDPTNPPRVRMAAAEALSRLDDPDLGALVLGQLESPDPQVRRWTLLMLADTGSSHGQDEIQRLAMLDPEPDLRQLAASIAGTP